MVNEQIILKESKVGHFYTLKNLKVVYISSRFRIVPVESYLPIFDIFLIVDTFFNGIILKLVLDSHNTYKPFLIENCLCRFTFSHHPLWKGTFRYSVVVTVATFLNRILRNLVFSFSKCHFFLWLFI